MADLYSTDYLSGVVNSLQTVPQFLYDSFFNIQQTENSEEIHFDVESHVMKLAPFVSPLVEGAVVTEKGFRTDSFKPAYIKPKSPLDPTRPLKRYMGEQIGGTLSPQQRRQLIVAEVLRDHRSMIDRRMEWMCAQILMTGAVVVSGDKYPTQNVNFQRDAALTVTLGAGSRWGEASVNPLNDLQDWSDLILEKSGSTSTNIVMTTDVWKVFRSDAEVKSRLDIRRTGNTPQNMAQSSVQGIGGSYKGNIDGYDIWVYSGSYVDSAGATQKMLDAGTVLLLGDIMGVRAFGAIIDEEVLNAIAFYSKSWIQPDPSRRTVMTQSAPLPVPYRVNAMLKAKVLA